MSKVQLNDVARSLFKGAPPQFEAFLRLFEEYTTEAVTATVTAPTEEVLRAQGRAQTCVALLRVLKECKIDRKPSTPQP